MRKLATIRKIDEIRPIPDADAIEAAVIGGWVVVIRKGEFAVGDFAIYCELDSWIPHTIAPFLSKGHEPRTFEGIVGERLRTVKLRGVCSQGLLLPLSVVDSDIELTEGTDVSENLGIVKWDAPIPAQLSGIVKGSFPSWGKRTDQERCQNLVDEIQQAYDNDVKFEVTIKLDGTSMSFGKSPDGEYTICSRNLNLKTDQSGNTLVNLCSKYEIERKLQDLPSIMLSGECIGEGVQKNKETIKGQDVYIFDVWDPIRQSYVSNDERYELVSKLGLKHVPILHKSITLKELGLHNVFDILKYAEGPSLNAKSREGIVFKSVDGHFSFKAISNAWLLKNE